ncbi:MAG: GAP family protein [Candidatus Nanopelagicales bacterium]
MSAQSWTNGRALTHQLGQTAAVRSLLGVVVPLAIGAAMSPTIAVLVITLLSGDSKPRKRADAFAVGALAAFLFWAAIVLTAVWSAVQSVESDIGETISSYTKALDIVLGGGLVAWGIYRLVRGPKVVMADAAQRHHRFSFDALATGPIWRQTTLGFIMQVRNVTTVVLYCAALQRISSSGLPLYEQLPVIALVIAIAMAAVWLPMLISVRTADEVKTKLDPVGEWLKLHGRAITIGASLVFGSYLVARAFG